MQSKLRLVIRSVDNMGKAVRFYSEVLDLCLRSQSSDWTEFGTGDTILALHPASAVFPAGSTELYFIVDDVHKFYEQAKRRGVEFVTPPARQPWGTTVEMLDSEGQRCSVGTPERRTGPPGQSNS